MYEKRFAVIVENDESAWNDKAGVHYHFPSMYRNILTPGTKVIYYKGVLQKKKYRTRRLLDEAHYFGRGVIGQVTVDEASKKGDLYAAIIEYEQFPVAVPSKTDNSYLEVIPPNLEKNYWRKGVRVIDEDTYRLIISKAGLDQSMLTNLEAFHENQMEYQSGKEGRAKSVYSSKYERNPELRAAAIRLHGLSCKVCSFNFADEYGEYAQGMIHVHHIVPLSEVASEHEVDPKTDLVPLCPNCHAVVHRRQKYTLSIQELKEMWETQNQHK